MILFTFFVYLTIYFIINFYLVLVILLYQVNQVKMWKVALETSQNKMFIYLFICLFVCLFYFKEHFILRCYNTEYLSS